MSFFFIDDALTEQTPSIRGSATSSASGGSTVTISTPATNNGDMLFVFIATSGSEGTGLTPPAGWNTISAGSNRRAFWRPVVANQSASTEDFGTVASRWSAICWAMASVDVATAPERAGSSGTSTSPDPASLTPSWGDATNIWLAVYYVVGVGAVTHSAYPASYTLGQANIAGTASIRFIAGAGRVLSAITEDPGAATISTSALWNAETFAFRPNYL